jgi:hypothetical protein
LLPQMRSNSRWEKFARKSKSHVDCETHPTPDLLSEVLTIHSLAVNEGALHTFDIDRLSHCGHLHLSTITLKLITQ